MKTPTFATIVMELSKAGLHAYCEELDEDCFCVGGNLDPLVELINDAESFCNPETRIRLTEKGKREAEKLRKEERCKDVRQL